SATAPPTRGVDPGEPAGCYRSGHDASAPTSWGRPPRAGSPVTDPATTRPPPLRGAGRPAPDHVAGQWGHERAHRPPTAGPVRYPADRRLVPPRQLPRRGPAVGGPAGRPRRVLLRPRPARDHGGARPEDPGRPHPQRRGAAPR